MLPAYKSLNACPMSTSLQNPKRVPKNCPATSQNMAPGHVLPIPGGGRCQCEAASDVERICQADLDHADLPTNPKHTLKTLNC
jgi:hypothetical protein